MTLGDLFLRVSNLALTAGWVALVIMLARLLLRRAPRWISCGLWGLVALRLLLPATFESVFSLIPSAQPLPENIAMAPVPQIDSGIAAVDRVVNPALSETLTPAVGASVNPMQLLLALGSVVWLIGVAAMLIYATVSYLRIRRRVRASLPTGDGAYVCDDIDTPFILGVIRPRIYLPSVLRGEDTTYVIAHERAHLRRLDHIWKPLGFLLLSVYWFQPLLWVAYWLLCRDIEAACDERVIREMDGGDRKRYSEALLSCSVRSRALSACPLAFGEVGVKARVRAVLNYKRPAFWLILLAVVLSIILAVGLISNPWQYPVDLLQPGTSWADEDGTLELTVHENFEILGTLKIDGVEHDVRMLYRERYAEICHADDPNGDTPLLKCGLRPSGRKLRLLVREDAAGTGLTRLVLRNYLKNPSITQIPDGMHTDYDGIYLTIDTISTEVLDTGTITVPTLHASWHNDTKDVQAMYGEPYAIDYWNGSAWINLTPPNMAFELPGIMLKPGEVKEKVYSTEAFDLSHAGRYRLRSSFSIEDLPYREWVKTQNQYETWVEFEISAKEMPEWTVENTDTSLYAPVSVDEATLAKLRTRYPEYFELDTTDGVTVYVWQMAAGSYCCGLLAGQPDEHELIQLLQLRGASVDEMKAILTSYRLRGNQITIEPTTMAYSSYFYKIDDGYRWGIKALFEMDGYTPHIDTVMFDIDGDGEQECVMLSVGSTYGRSSFRLSVYDLERERSEYHGVFELSTMQLRFKVAGNKLYLCSAAHTYEVTMQDGVVSITENGVPIGG